jgi:4-hydroxy-3-polyprenylbenzoate decarboxylase
MTDQSLRGFLDLLEADGQLLRVSRRVDARHELAAWLGIDDDGPALLFEDVSGSDTPVVGNVVNSRERLAVALGVPVAALTATIAHAVSRSGTSRLLTDPPCQEVVHRSVDLGQLPIPWFFEHESGPYITAGAVVARDPETGRPNLSIARLKPLGGSRALIGIAPNHHLAIMARKAADRGEGLPMAVAIGLHPALLLGAALYLDLGDDELEHVAELFGTPLELARCLSVDLQVPAHAEFVLEGVLQPEMLVDEGPVSEFHGMYEDYGPAPTVEFTVCTHRSQPILQVIEPGYHPEHIVIGAVAIAAIVRRTLQRIGVPVVEVAVGMAGAGRLSASVALESPRPGDARRCAFAIWGAVSLIKQVTVVDDDVDVWDDAAVERARLLRSRPERDLLIVPATRADRSEPLEHDGLGSKLAIDATMRPEDRELGFRTAEPPSNVVRLVEQQWRDLGRMRG